MGNSQFTRRQFIKAGTAGAFAAWTVACDFSKDFDLILVGGTLIDGSGQPGKIADVGVKQGVIAAIGDLKDRSAGRKIDISGLVAAPGFIDYHSHSDDELLLGGEAQSKIRQGVTTEILGQDGGSMAPLNAKMYDRLLQRYQERWGIEIKWTDFAGYFQRLEQGGMITNAASMLGQGTLRQCVVGDDDRPATAEEIARMKELAETAFKHGVYGISSGLEYTPGSFASTEEIIEICKSMNGRGVYSSHMRNEDDTVLEAIREAIQIAKSSGVDLNISHLKASGQRNWHKMPQMLALLDEARNGGMTVTCDRYPYVAYNTGLSSLFPLWSRDGGQEKFVERLQDASLLPDIKAEVMKKVTKIGGWRSVMVSSLPKNPNRKQFEGRHLEELASTGQDPFELLLQLILQENGGGGMVGFAMSEENTSALLAYSHCMTASDASSIANEGILHKGNPHPRGYGTFPRVLGKYVREDSIMSLEEAVRKMSALPASAMSIKDRGYLKKEYQADIAVFDPATVIDNATWSEPHQYPSGIPYVIVNGEVVIDQEKFTGTLAGKVLRM